MFNLQGDQCCLERINDIVWENTCTWRLFWNFRLHLNKCIFRRFLKVESLLEVLPYVMRGYGEFCQRGPNSTLTTLF